jgi:hypothetical protein
MKKAAFVSALLVMLGSMPSYADTVWEATELIRTAERSFIIEVDGTHDPENIEIAIENTGPLPVIIPPASP